jgi:hypothetical protein
MLIVDLLKTNQNLVYQLNQYELNQQLMKNQQQEAVRKKDHATVNQKPDIAKQKNIN